MNKMTKITAQEARELAGPSVQDRVNDVYPLIRKAAERKEHKISLHGWWAHQGYGQTADWKKACELLAKDGFNTRFFYEELQFVNMYTIVSW
jgi:hypothetical protein